MYYSLSEITPNLYTDGNEFIYKKTSKSYKGYYYSTTDGKYYTGGTFSPKSEEIVKSNINKLLTSTNPTNYTPIPSESDYSKGYITRYATKRVNCGFDTIMEIDKSEYDRLTKNILYTTVSFNWKITGPTYSTDMMLGILDTNQKTLLNLENKIPDLSSFFINFAQYAKID